MINILFVVHASYTFSSQIAQLALAAGLNKIENINITLIGNYTEVALEYIKRENLNFVIAFPSSKIDNKYIEHFSNQLVEKKIDIVHFVDGKSARSGLIALKKFPKIKSVIYYGSASLHWHDLSAYLTYLHPRIDAIIGNSNYVYEHVKKQLFGKRKQKAVRIFKGYSPEWFKDTVPFDYTTLGIPKNAIVVCSIGNHRKVKGTRYFLESSYFLKSNKEIHYILIGENTNVESLQKIVNDSPITDKIHVLGRRNDVGSLLLSADMYVQTSLSEGFGRAISEAMSFGKPIVMTDAGGCTELIDEKSGIVVPKKASKEIARAISKLSDNDEMRIEMGNQAKKRIETVYSIERTVKETYELYQKLLNV